MAKSPAAQLSLDVSTPSAPSLEQGTTPMQDTATKPERVVKSAATKPSSGALPPMMQDYLRHKREYPEHALLYQVGDFFEVFFEDAERVSATLGIRLTARHKDSLRPVQMCGVPIHAIDNYLPKLLNAGISCVIVKQIEENSADDAGRRATVRREISRIVTPGVRYEEDGLVEHARNFLAAVCYSIRGDGAIAYTDVSTGMFRVQQHESFEEIIEGLQRIEPAEIILPSTLFNVAVAKTEGRHQDLKQVAARLGAQVQLRPFDNPGRSAINSRLEKQFVDDRNTRCRNQIQHALSEFDELGMGAIDAILNYIEEISFGGLPRIVQLQIESPETTVVIDAATRRNLELLETRIDGESKHSLVHQINYTKTSMGYRMLQDALLAPLASLEEITSRHDAVEELFHQPAVLEDMQSTLSGVRDLERLVNRISGMRSSPYDFGVLRESISDLPELSKLLRTCSSNRLKLLAERLDTLEDVHAELKGALVADLPVRAYDGEIFAVGYNEHVDHFRAIRKDGRKWLLSFEESERERTGIGSLKVKYNNVFGYFIEVTKNHLDKVPADFQRKQTLSNAERFVTDALKQREEEILSAKARQIEAERELFDSLRSWVRERVSRVQATAEVLSELDLLCSFAYLAREHGYTRPKMSTGVVCHIVEGRHPVVERVIGSHNFVSNDTDLDGEARRFAVLTGPNMGGKSTYLRQIGLIQLLAQAGSFVPARHAELGIVDRIFTRIGAADDMTRGDSTFMVEMREAATIVRKATPRSLVLIDEIGRGTATTDGLAIATAIAEWLLETSRCKTVFATHFHELTHLGQHSQGAFCLSVGVLEESDELVFTHRIEEGAASRSYGVEVARLAGLPRLLVDRAATLLESLTEEAVQRDSSYHEQTKVNIAPSSSLMQDYENLVTQLKQIDCDSMTPLQALSELSSLSNSARKI